MKRLPTRDELVKLEKAAEKLTRSGSQGERERGDKALEKCKEIAQKLDRADEARRKVRHAVQRKLAPFLAAVEEMGKSVGFKGPVIRAASVGEWSTDVESATEDEGKRKGKKKGYSYPTHLTGKDMLMWEPDEEEAERSAR